jgi:diguanylate cyclase (GGDEF)-like protein
VARYGGEEFAILLPQEDVAGAETVARRVLDEIEVLGIAHARSSAAPIVTVSMGVAAVTPNEKLDAGQLVKLADALLYQAKAGGRNRFVLSKEPD